MMPVICKVSREMLATPNLKYEMFFHVLSVLLRKWPKWGGQPMIVGVSELLTLPFVQYQVKNVRNFKIHCPFIASQMF